MNPMNERNLSDLKADLLKALADFEAEAERIGLKPKACPICRCGCEIEKHVAHGCMGKQGRKREPCDCKGFKSMEPPEVDPFTTVEYYMRDRKGIWTGD